MIIVSYDIQNNKIRSEFSKFLKKYGRKIQYSVYEIKNSTRILNNIILEIEEIYKPKFTKSDSVIIFSICDGCKNKIKRFGYAINEEKEVLIFK